MASLLEISPVMWRKKLRQASFKLAAFHVESQGRTSGRRAVLHEYPKRDVPYAEDMGRAAVNYQITGYVIQRWGNVPIGNMPNDYDMARDLLIQALESNGPGTLVDPYNNAIGPMSFQCQRYTLTESREHGGYAQFEMMFVEAGMAGGTFIGVSTVATLVNAANNSNAAAGTQLNTRLGVANAPGGLPLLS